MYYKVIKKKLYEFYIMIYTFFSKEKKELLSRIRDELDITDKSQETKQVIAGLLKLFTV